MDDTSTLIFMDGIYKRFGAVVANNDVSFDLHVGEIHGLLGENGAGKTTLMNILYGLHQPDEGQISIGDRERHIASPHDAIGLGVGMVHQHFMQVPTLSVIDNIILGLSNEREPLLDRARAAARLEEISETYNLHVDPNAYIWQLSVGDRQRVEILKVLFRDARVLILDEPTAVLTPQETHDLFRTIRGFVDNGLSVVFITHKLEEAMSITDRVTVLRDGHVVATTRTVDTNKAELARLMVGRDILFRIANDDQRQPAGKTILQVRDLRVMSDRDTPAVQGVSFSVASGEIVGIAGVDGNGQTELIQALTGLRRSIGGGVAVGGVDVTDASPQRILQEGVGHIPEDFDDALIGEFTLVENLALDMHYAPPFSTHGILDHAKMRQSARELIRRYDVRAPHENVKAKTLSGGNKQKLVIARETSRNPRLLIAAHPTRGLDIGAEEYIRGLMLELRAAGMAILLVSTKLDEILSLCDRILVMERGKIMGEVPRAEADIEQIGLLMAGIEA